MAETPDWATSWTDARKYAHLEMTRIIEGSGISKHTSDMLAYFVCESVPSNCSAHLREIADAAWVPKRKECVKVKGSSTVGVIHRFFFNPDGTLLASLKGRRRGQLAIVKPSLLEPYSGETNE